MCFDVIFKVFFCICRHGLHLVSDIYLACYRFGDEGLTVFFEEVDFFAALWILVRQSVRSFVVKDVGNLLFVL